MKKRSASKNKKPAGKSKERTMVRRKDAQLTEFEKRDLGDDIQAARSAVVLRGPLRPTSILLDPELVQKLREKGAKRGLGYQTMLKLIVAEHVDEY